MACATLTSGSDVLVPAKAFEDDDHYLNLSTIITQTRPEDNFEPPTCGYDGLNKFEPSIDALGDSNNFEESDVTKKGNNTPNFLQNTNPRANINSRFDYPSVSIASLLYPKLTHDFHFSTDHDINDGMADSEQPRVKKGRQRQQSYMVPKKGNG